MPTPAESASILKAAMDTGFDPVKLAVLRGSSKREAEGRFANALNSGDMRDAARWNVLSHDAESDMADDPFTGDAEAARVGGIQKSLDAATTTLRPEVADASRATANRNAFAEFMKTKEGARGKFAAETSPEGVSALDAASVRQTLGKARGEWSPDFQNAADAQNKRDIQRAEAAKGATFGDLGQGVPNAPAPKLTPSEQDAMDKSRAVGELGPQLLKMFEAQYPGIDASPQKYGSVTDTLGAKLGGAIYRFGKTQTPADDAINTMTGYLEATLPRMLASGRINQQQYNDLKLHVPQVGFSPGANYERTRYILQNILPVVTRTMGQNGQVQDTRGGDRIADPNWGR